MAIRRRCWTWNGEEKSAWVVDYFDLKGKRRLKTFKSKREAVDFAATTHVDIKVVPTSRIEDSITVADAGKLWLVTCQEDGLERSSIARNRQHLELHIMPLIGSTKLSKLNVPEVRKFADKLRAKERSEALSRMVMVSLGSILADAHERGLATSNPVRDLKRRRGMHRKTAAKARRAPLAVGVDIPTAAEIRLILAISSGRQRAIFVMASLVGLRGSELRGLRWQDIDLTKPAVSVWQRADAWGDIGKPKSQAGYRTIPLPQLVVNALKEWKLACPKGKRNSVFPNGKGNVELHQNIVKRHWHPLQLSAGVAVPLLDRGTSRCSMRASRCFGPSTPGLHALRHFYCSWCAARPQDGGLGLPLKTVQVRMGHSTLAMTADRYGHLFPSQDDTEVLAAGEAALMRATT